MSVHSLALLLIHSDNPGYNNPIGPLPGRRISRPAPYQALRFPESPSPDDDVLESRIVDSIVDDKQGFVLCDESSNRCSGGWLHPGNRSFCDVFL